MSLGKTIDDYKNNMNETLILSFFEIKGIKYCV